MTSIPTLVASRQSTKSLDDSEAVPPPPYSNNTPFLLTETRTTRTQVITTRTETTTETTTHVLPIFQPADRHAGALLEDSASTSGQELSHSASPPGFLALDKDLPPVPRTISFELSRSTRDLEPSTSSSSSISHLGLSTIAVGFPALGPDLINHTVSATGTPLPFQPTPKETQPSPRTTLRKSKSTHKLRQAKGVESGNGAEGSGRRARGISFGAVSWLAFASVDAKGKGKDNIEQSNQQPPTPDRETGLPLKPLSRKSSFWSRQKAAPSQPPSASQPKENLLATATTAIKSSNDPVPVPHNPSTPPSQSRPVPRPLSLARRHSEYIISPTKPTFDIPPLPTTPFTPEAIQPTPPLVSQPSPSFPPLTPSHDVSNAGPPSRAPRARAQTNPPLLHRLSTAFLSSFVDSPIADMPSTPNPEPTSRPDAKEVPKPLASHESPEVYVSRLRSVVSKAEIAGILASSADPFYTEALNIYLRQFNFHDEPLDIALRKLLMEVGLPRETQQIDRVMEAFSSRYSQCNPNLFASQDHGYVLAFSLIMLHTDAFNPSNKSKMSKADYVKNTSLAGLPAEVLGCYYDNIVFAPFIFIEDPLDINGMVGIAPETPKRLRTPSTPTSATLLGKPKVDPYHLITNNLLRSMRDEVEAEVPLENPYSCIGTGRHSWSDERLQEAFSRASVIGVETSNGQPSFTVAVGGENVPLDFGNGAQPTVREDGHTSSASSMSIRASMVGVLNRKDDMGLRGKRNTIRKWKSWTVLLTGSQLLFFRNSLLAKQISHVLNPDQAPKLNDSQAPTSISLKPDEIISVKDAVALYDKTYKKHCHTFRFVLPDGRQILLQGSNDGDMDEWITKINYASAFKSAGVRIRPPSMSPEEAHMTGVAAATSLLHDTQHSRSSPSTRSVKAWDSSISHELMGMLSPSSDSFALRPAVHHRLTIVPSREVDIEHAATMDSATSQQFEATFKRVKADLAHDAPFLDNVISPLESPPTSPVTTSSTSSRPLTRTDIIRRKIDDLEAKLGATQSQLDSELRFVRNIAILKPFQATARAKLLNPVQAISRKIQTLRLEAARLECHRSVLQRDLDCEMRSLDQMQSVALEAAKRSLDRGSPAIPRMTISVHEGDTRSKTLSAGTFSRSWSNCSTTDSFRSAMEYPEEHSSSALSVSYPQLLDSPRPSLTLSSPIPPRTSNDSRSSFFEGSTSLPSSTGGSPREPSPSFSSGHDDTVEEAEAWDRTRCAQRVSLVRVPSTLSFNPRRDGAPNLIYH